MSSASQTLSAEVRAHLARHRKSPADLAPVLNVSAATVYRRLSDQGEWTLDEAMSVALWLGEPLADLLSDSEDVA